MIGDPTELLMFLEKSTTELRAKVVKGGWAWRKGVEIFIAPESRCSFCNESFETNRVYLVDNTYQMVPRQWRLATGTKVRMGNKMYHPHAFYQNGATCMNAAKGMAQLLFNSINTGPTYHSDRYFWDVGHTCPKFATETCLVCQKKVPHYALEHFVGARTVCSTQCAKTGKKDLCLGCYMPHGGVPKFSKNGLGPYCEKCVTRVNALADKGDPDDE